MPALPFPYRGAEQMDRAFGIKQLIRLGYDVRVIAKVSEWQKSDFVQQTADELGIQIIPIPYRYSNRNLKIKDKLLKLVSKLSNPMYLDGAAFEYSESGIQNALKWEIENWKPDVVWFEYSYLWPLYHIPSSRNIPIVTRSINFEPNHFLEEDGKSPINLVKYIPKYIGESLISKRSDVVFSITPKEQKIYTKMGAKRVVNLPLRALPNYLEYNHPAVDKKTLNVFFMGSTYTVEHNKKALLEVIARIAPAIYKSNPTEFKFYIIGNKFPTEYNKYLVNNVEYVGYVDDIDEFMNKMDIALIPSLFGAGMQQKIFESLVRGFPTITSERGIGDYSFTNDVDVLFASNSNEFCESLLKLKDFNFRQKLSENAVSKSKELFSNKVYDQTVMDVLDSFQKPL